MNDLLQRKVKFLIFVLLSYVALIDPSLAGTTLSGLESTIKTSSHSIADIIKFVAAIAGFFLIVMGVSMFMQSQRSQESPAQAIIYLAVGAALLSPLAITGIGTSAIFGNDSQGLQDLGL